MTVPTSGNSYGGGKKESQETTESCVFVSNFYNSGRSYFSPLVVGAICPATSTDGHKCFGSGKTIVISNLPGK